MNTDEAQKLTVRDILMSQEGYRVPEYQRNYAWKAAEITQLIEDVRLAHAASQSTYYLGNIVTTRSANDVHDVVDGQQRLTTLVLLISYLRIALGKTDDPSTAFTHPLTFSSRSMATVAIRRLSTAASHDAAMSALDGLLVDSRGDDRTGEGTRGPLKGLHSGYLAIRSAVQETWPERPEEMETFLGFLLDRVEMIRVVLPQGTDLNRYFEVMNTRGAQLEPTDIVRAKLMSALTEDQAQIRTFQRLWDACAQMEGFIQIAISRGNPRLRTALFGDEWEWLRASTFEELTEHLGASDSHDNTATHGSRDLTAALDDYLETASAPGAAEDEQTNRQFPATIRFPFLLLHALTLFERQQGAAPRPQTEADTGGTEDSDDGAEDPALDDQRLIKRFEDVFERTPDGRTITPDPEKVRRFAIHLLRVRNLFDAYIVRRHQSGPDTGDDDNSWVLKMCGKRSSRSNGEVTYRDTFGHPGTDESSREAPTVPGARSDQVDLVLLESMLRVTFTSSRSMRWITDVLASALDHHFPHRPTGAVPEQWAPSRLPVEQLRTLLKDVARSRIRPILPPTASQSAGASDRPSADDHGMQRTGFDIPRIVYTYLDYLLLDHRFDSGSKTGAHPTPVKAAEFIFRFRNSVEHFAPRTRDEETDRIIVTETSLQSLGNLALVTVRQNSKFSNSSPKTKADSSEAVLAQSPKLWRMAELTVAAGAWRDEQITAHHLECVDLLRRDLYPVSRNA